MCDKLEVFPQLSDDNDETINIKATRDEHMQETSMYPSMPKENNI